MGVVDPATAQIRVAYSAVATTYDRLLPDVRVEAAIDLAMVEHFLAQVGAGRGADLLDAGCGTGRMIAHLERLDPSLHLTGADLSPGMVARARAKHPTRRIDEADLAALPFGEAAFDGVLAWYAIIHTPASGLPGIVAEFRRVLRPGGALLLGFHAGSGERAAHRAYGHDVELTVQLHEPAVVAHALATGGFEVLARLERAARPGEKNPQGFLLAARS